MAAKILACKGKLDRDLPFRYPQTFAIFPNRFQFGWGSEVGKGWIKNRSTTRYGEPKRRPESEEGREIRAQGMNLGLLRTVLFGHLDQSARSIVSVFAHR